MESLDAYYAFTDDAGAILAGAGMAGDVLKCLAVSPEVRSEGLLVPLVSRILSERPGQNLKVFTKPEYQAVFESLGFRLLARAPLAILLENGRGLEKYCDYLRSFRREGRCGVVVMNANPFTLGHRYLLQQAAAQVDHLFVIPVKEDLSDFPYAERLAMIQAGVSCHSERAFCHSERAKRVEESTSASPTSVENYFSGRCPKNQFSSDIAMPTHADARITVLEGSDYVISAATFPTYFLKDLSDAAETQMQLDTDLYARWIAPALGASVRFVGSEPFDALTARYNQLIPNAVEIPRLEQASASPTSAENYFSGRCPKNQFPSDIAMPTHADAISASRVRAALAAGHFRAAAALCPETTWPYLLAALVERALRLELDTPGKPGLVGPDGPGAHKDMDYGTMLSGIKALRPFWSRMALAGSVEELRQLGIDAEAAMMAATGGVNTHRGAIFCMGLALNATGRFCQLAYNETLMQNALGDIAGRILCNELNIKDLTKTPLKGARRIAASGYQILFEDWLPYYRTLCNKEAGSAGPVGFSGASAILKATEKPTPGAELRLLLRIMSTLDDTCVVKRVGEERAQEVKKEAKAVLEEIPGQARNEGTRAWDEQLCARYAQEGISPGGAADMLALTIFIDSIIS